MVCCMGWGILVGCGGVVALAGAYCMVVAAALRGLVHIGWLWLRSCRGWCILDGSGCGLAGAGAYWTSQAADLQAPVAYVWLALLC